MRAASDQILTSPSKIFTWSSGLDATTGAASIPCVKADQTITMAFMKSGFFQNEGPSMCGEVSVAEISIPQFLVDPCSCMLVDEAFAAESRALGAEVRGRDVLPLLAGELRPEMVEALKRISAQLKTGCITNNLPANAIGSADGRSFYVADVMALFDHVIESAKIGLRKPDPKIYQMMVEALGVDPKRCVYLDDIGVNLKPARDMGMTTIKVVTADTKTDRVEGAKVGKQLIDQGANLLLVSADYDYGAPAFWACSAAGAVCQALARAPSRLIQAAPAEFRV